LGWITTREAAEQSGYSKDWVTRMAQAGAFEAEKKDQRWWIDQDDFLRWVEEQKESQNGRHGPRQ
jgi:excisionase family DNA binding protein